MATLYMQSGMFLHGVGGYYFENENNNNRNRKSGERYGEKQNSKAFGGIIPKIYAAQEPLEFPVWHGDRENWWQHLPLLRGSPRVSQIMV